MGKDTTIATPRQAKKSKRKRRQSKQGQKESRSEKAERLREALLWFWRSSDRWIARQEDTTPTTIGKYRKQLEDEELIVRRVKNGHPVEPWLQDVSILAIDPAPENDKLYDPVREDDPAFVALDEDIRKNGILEDIVVSADGYIVSGHRRYAAAKKVGLDKVPIRVRPDIHRGDDLDGFLALLASYNKQRVKTTSEVVKEGIVGAEDDTWHRLRRYRRKASAINGVETIRLVGKKKRSEIKLKLEFRDTIRKVVFDNRADWPLSDRDVFYLLLNIPGLVRNHVTRTPFLNDDASYTDVTNMVTRMRLDGTIPFDSIGDETRPVVLWNTHRSVGPFVEDQLDGFLCDYWRDLQQSQANWHEALIEKNTRASKLRKVAAKYTIPMTSGRGYSSLPPRKAMIDRFLESGREKLVVIVVSDFDPEGEDIPHALGLSLRDDFDLRDDQIVIIKAALTHAQTQTLDLHEGQFVKTEGSRYRKFVEKYGERVWELEAVPADTLRDIVEDTIRRTIDLEAFEAEVTQQLEEQEQLDEHRKAVMVALADVDFDEGAE